MDHLHSTLILQFILALVFCQQPINAQDISDRTTGKGQEVSKTVIEDLNKGEAELLQQRERQTNRIDMNTAMAAIETLNEQIEKIDKKITAIADDSKKKALLTKKDEIQTKIDNLNNKITHLKTIQNTE